jgi:hypothetical protein
MPRSAQEEHVHMQTRVAKERGMTRKEMQTQVVERLKELASASNAGVLYLKTFMDGGGVDAEATTHMGEHAAALETVLAYLCRYQASGMNSVLGPECEELGHKRKLAMVAVTADAVRLIIAGGEEVGYSDTIHDIVTAHVEATIASRLVTVYK